jgi:homocitrate synthase NifV
MFDALRSGLHFAPNIDLLDETMREGAERATINFTLEEKVEVARRVSALGVRSIITGTFPEVPDSVELLRRLVDEVRAGRIAEETRFLVIAHLGPSLEKTIRLLHDLGDGGAQRTWIVGIYNVSDIGIQHHLPHTTKSTIDPREWSEWSRERRREQAVEWLETGLALAATYRGGGVMLGCMDAFRADLQHVNRVVEIAQRRGVSQIRLVDTAGTCLPEQLDTYVGELVEKFPSISFYGHFHNDFGLATANAVRALGLGLRGVDVTIGGLGNRAGHPPLAEVVTALHYLYGVTIPSFQYQLLNEASRYVERLYGLLEGATRAVTGQLTHGILSGHRTKLQSEERQLYDIIEPEFVGTKLIKMFGIRSAGADGVFHFMREHRARMEAAGIEVSQENAERLAPAVIARWKAHSAAAGQRLREAVGTYQDALNASFTSEEDILAVILQAASTT